MSEQLDMGTEVLVRGYGEVEYFMHDLATFSETTTLEKSLEMIKAELAGQTQYSKGRYPFVICRASDQKFIYQYLNGEIKVSEDYPDLKLE